MRVALQEGRKTEIEEKRNKRHHRHGENRWPVPERRYLGGFGVQVLNESMQEENVYLSLFFTLMTLPHTLTRFGGPGQVWEGSAPLR